MKLVIDEKLKHRIIGVAVIISLGAIFAPAMMKKSSQNIETNYSVHVKLPPKPEEPNVALADEKEVFKTIKIAKVNIANVSSESQLPELAKAERVQRDELVNELASAGTPVEQVALNKAAADAVQHAVRVASNQPKMPVKSAVVARNATKSVISKPTAVASKATKPVAQRTTVALKAKPVHAKVNIAKAAPVARKPAVKTELYAVQLASFAQLSNAQSLVNKLRSKGYKANFSKVASRNGVIYKVYAGHSPRKTEVIKLKTQLANAMQLNGFVVNTGVS